MKITSVKATAVNVPLAAPIRWSWGVRRETTRLIIQIETDEGISGFGETMGRVGWENRYGPCSEGVSAKRLRFPGMCSPGQEMKRPAKAERALQKNCSNSAKDW